MVCVAKSLYHASFCDVNTLRCALMNKLWKRTRVVDDQSQATGVIGLHKKDLPGTRGIENQAGLNESQKNKKIA